MRRRPTAPGPRLSASQHSTSRPLQRSSLCPLRAAIYPAMTILSILSFLLMRVCVLCLPPRSDAWARGTPHTAVRRCPDPRRRRRAVLAVNPPPHQSSAPASRPQGRAEPRLRERRLRLKRGEPRPLACRPGRRPRSERRLRQESARALRPRASGRRVPLRLPLPLLPPSAAKRPSSPIQRRPAATAPSA